MCKWLVPKKKYYAKTTNHKYLWGIKKKNHFERVLYVHMYNNIMIHHTIQKYF